MTDDPQECADLAPPEPCCAETANGPIDWWTRYQTDAHLLRTSISMARACPASPDAQAMCTRLAQAAWDQLGYRSSGLVPHRTAPLPYCDCPGGPNDS
jgi:hypothetical protein